MSASSGRAAAGAAASAAQTPPDGEVDGAPTEEMPDKPGEQQADTKETAKAYLEKMCSERIKRGADGGPGVERMDCE